MSCPTCDYTMKNVGHEDGGVPLFWCSRCGTLKANVGRGFDDIPMLVKDVRYAVKEDAVVRGSSKIRLKVCTLLPEDR